MPITPVLNSQKMTVGTWFIFNLQKQQSVFRNHVYTYNNRDVARVGLNNLVLTGTELHVRQSWPSASAKLMTHDKDDSAWYGWRVVGCSGQEKPDS